MAGGSFRYKKAIVPSAEKQKEKQASTLVRVGADGADAWHEEVFAFLTHLRETGLTDWNQITFLFRSVSGDKPRGLAEYLEAHGIPVYRPALRHVF